MLPRKRKEDKKFMLNLNVYRNTHYQILNQAKAIFTKEILDSLMSSVPKPFIKFTNPVEVNYTLFTGNARLLDTNNVLSIIDKFALDALVEIGILKNDTYKEVVRTINQFGGIDRANPRCEMEILEIGMA